MSVVISFFFHIFFIYWIKQKIKEKKQTHKSKSGCVNRLRRLFGRYISFTPIFGFNLERTRENSAKVYVFVCLDRPPMQSRSCICWNVYTHRYLKKSTNERKNRHQLIGIFHIITMNISYLHGGKYFDLCKIKTQSFAGTHSQHTIATLNMKWIKWTIQIEQYMWAGK